MWEKHKERKNSRGKERKIKKERREKQGKKER